MPGIMLGLNIQQSINHIKNLCLHHMFNGKKVLWRDTRQRMVERVLGGEYKYSGWKKTLVKVDI